MTLATRLQGSSVPVRETELIVGVKRFLDMSPTIVNVEGDLAACAVMNRWLRTADLRSTVRAHDRTIGKRPRILTNWSTLLRARRRRM